jgi:ferredoxin-NADP reductase
LFRIDQSTGKAVVIRDNADGFRDRLDAIRASCPFVAVEVDGVPLDDPIDDVPVAAANRLTHDVIELRLTRPGYAFTPGQYAFLRLRDTAGEFFRAYSLVGVERNEVSFCIKLLADGRGGRALRALKPGDVIGLGRALGTFTLATKDRSKLFITGGTGLSPVLPMCRAAPNADKTVIFGVRGEEDLFWLDVLGAIPRTTVIPVLEAPGAAWTGERGRVTDALRNLDVSGFSELYTCGSPGMVKAVKAQLIGQGVAETRIHADSFDASSPSPMVGEGFDWQSLYRRVHFYASVSLASLILFYAVTGFIANRVNLFVAEGMTRIAPAARQVPEAVPLTEVGLRSYLAGILPPTAQCTACEESDQEVRTRFTIAASGSDTAREVVATVKREDRTLAVEEWQRLPEDLPLDVTALTAFIRSHVSGEPDLGNREEDDKEFRIDCGSVWGVHTVLVDKVQRRWQVSTTRPELAVAIIDLHRGKHAGWLQKLLVDMTALLLVVVTVSGVAMGLTVAARIRRLITMALAGGSLLLLAIMLFNR